MASSSASDATVQARAGSRWISASARPIWRSCSAPSQPVRAAGSVLDPRADGLDDEDVGEPGDHGLAAGPELARLGGHELERAVNPARPGRVGASILSRSAFAARFTELVAEPVMQYVLRWRMHLALHALETEEVTVGELAYRLGYRSEAAFARAFKRVIGLPPGGARRGGGGHTASPAQGVAAAS